MSGGYPCVEDFLIKRNVPMTGRQAGLLLASPCCSARIVGEAPGTQASPRHSPDFASVPWPDRPATLARAVCSFR